jgi:predicted phosphodiesterase
VRIAVMSDIHGFDLALDVVRRDLAANGPFDQIVVAGDLAAGGPDPQKVIDTVRAEGWYAVKGNTDHDLVEAAEWATGLDEVGWWVEHLSDDAIDFLATLPFSHRVMPPGGTGPEHELLVVHANPHDLHGQFDPALPDRELREVIGDETAGTIVFGHVHIAYIRHVDGKTLVDVSAVGNPKGGDMRIHYGILTWDQTTMRWTAEIRRLDYPVSETEQEMRAAGLPDVEEAIQKLHRVSY